ncbi:Phosphatidylinositol glycan anchor biosynthesis class U protein [Toxocara canis]|uniref:Phosphatidylinositol glycan anchor biosynthesis class U protein n=1 Tax=Toxocara canis TaxID=6265 RepID=A0A0B2UWC6_TOXCA|nr:Phosphatidylinositol glycan anchor biosynthesis class U protein [Toxocara canis]
MGKQLLNRLPMWCLVVLARVLTKYYGEDWLARRPELVVAHNSFRRLVDGIRMRRSGFSPYEGDMLHCAPMLLNIMEPLVDHPNIVFTVFMVFDLMIGELLRSTGSVYTKINEGMEKSKSDRICGIIAKLYLFNPLVIASCAICSLSVFYNLLIALFLFSFIKGWLVGSAVLCGLLVELTLYPVVFIFALFIRFASTKSKTLVCLLALFSIGAFTLLDTLCARGIHYIYSTHLFLLSVPDLTPNVGIFWYFFTEVFSHFRLFFLWVFQLNVFIYLFPLTFTLRSNPFLLLHQLLILISVFASYPTMTDSAIYLSLTPIFVSLHKYARWTLVIAVTWATCVVLSPVMWQMWVVTGSGNANFYFAVTLCYSMAQIFLMTDLLYSDLRKKAALARGNVADDGAALFVFK